MGLFLTLGLTAMGLFFLAFVMVESRNLGNPMPVFTLLIGGGMFASMMFGPVGKAIGRMFDDDTSRGDDQLAMRVEDLEARLLELSLEQSRVMELEGRIDFAERMLLKEPRRDGTSGGSHGAAQ